MVVLGLSQSELSIDSARVVLHQDRVFKSTAVMFACKTCSLEGEAEGITKHLSTTRHKTVLSDADGNSEVACEDCDDTNIHMLQIIRFEGDDMRLLCNSCFKKEYTESERPSTLYSLSNGTILKFWDRYLKVRDCCCDKCGNESNLNALNPNTVLCDKCLSTIKSQEAQKYVSESSGRFLYTLLGIKEPSKTPKRKGKFKRKLGRRSKGKGKPMRSRASTPGGEEKKLTVMEKINLVSNTNRLANTKITSSNDITLGSFRGVSAPSGPSIGSRAPDKSKHAPKSTKSNISNSVKHSKPGKSSSTKNVTSSGSKAVGRGDSRTMKDPKKMKSKENGEQKSQSRSKGSSEKSKVNDKSAKNKKAGITATNTEGLKSKRDGKSNSVAKFNGKDSDKSNENRQASKSKYGSGSKNSNGQIKEATKSKNGKERKEQPQKKNNKNEKKTNDDSVRDKKQTSKTNLKKNNESGSSNKIKNDDKPIADTAARNKGDKEIEMEEGVVHKEYKKFQPKLRFNDLKEYCREFSNAIFQEQKLENDFVFNFNIKWPANSVDNVFLITINMKNNEEIEKLMTPVDIKLKKMPFKNNSPIIFSNLNETELWYAFIKETDMQRNQMVLLIELFGWNDKPLPVKQSSEKFKFLPLSASAKRVLFAMSRIDNPTFIDMLLGQKDIKKLEFNNRMKFTNDRFNDSQKRAIQNVLNNKVTILQGPPGTGKTATIEEIILQMREHFNSFPILCVAASNIAIDNIAEKFIEKRPDIKILRIVSRTKEKEYGMDHPLGKICLHNIVRENLNEESRDTARKLAMGQTKSFSKNALMRYFRDKEGIVNKYINQCTIIFSTNVAAGSTELKVIKEIPVVIMDESTQSSEVSTLIPLSLPGIKTFVFVGDDKQLSSFSDIPQLSLSLFERILQNGTYQNPHMLNTQYRMHPTISEFPRTMIYKNELQDGVTAEQKQLDKVAHPVYFYDYRATAQNREQLHRVRRRDVTTVSYYNRAECRMILEVVHMLVIEKGVPLEDIGIITPYAGQREQLATMVQADELINPRGLVIEKQSEEKDLFSVNEQSMGSNNTICIVNGLQVSTVDAFQGHEKSVIVFSCVRNNESNTIGFLKDQRRLNVALTRAKNSLVIVGCSSVLSRSDSIWKKYIDYLSKNKMIHTSLSEY